MELKLRSLKALFSWAIRVLIVPLWNWNRGYPYQVPCGQCVLIVPLWNWNHLLCSQHEERLCVLIVPLWNWNTSRWVVCWLAYCSNCTFMELKFLWLCPYIGRYWVLIVPLWNWNQAKQPIEKLRPIVLIVPLWNWNAEPPFIIR